MQQRDARRPPWWWNAVIAAAALGMALVMRPAFMRDWDEFDYTVAAVEGQPSSLATERAWFTGLHAVAWRAANLVGDVDRADAWRLFQNVTTALAVLAAIAVFRAAFLLTRSRLAAVTAIALWLLSPLAMLYASAIMTETPTTLMLALSIILVEHGAKRSGRRAVWLAVLAGAAFGVAANMREPLIVLGLYFVGRTLFVSGRGWGLRVGTLIAGLGAFAAAWGGGIALAIAMLPGGWEQFHGQWSGWYADMAKERDEIGNLVGRNFLHIVIFMLTTSAVVVAWCVPALVYAVRRSLAARKAGGEQSPVRAGLWWLLAGTGAYTVTLLSNHDLNVNPRFVLFLALPLAILCSAVLADAARRRSMGLLAIYAATAVAVVGLCAASITTSLSGYFAAPPSPAIVEIWALAVLVAGLLVAAVILVVGRRGPTWIQPLAAPGMAAAAAAFALMACHYGMQFQNYRDARWRLEYAQAITAPDALPADAVLIPGPGTPVVQYLRNLGVRGEWDVVSSGWAWPDGHEGQKHLYEVVADYHRAGRDVYVFGGPSSWRPDAFRNNEWPDIRMLQERYVIERSGPGDMLRVIPRTETQPDTGAEFEPLGTGDYLREDSAKGAARRHPR